MELAMNPSNFAAKYGTHVIVGWTLACSLRIKYSEVKSNLISANDHGKGIENEYKEELQLFNKRDINFKNGTTDGSKNSGN